MYQGISLFSGIGGFELGLRIAGLEQHINVSQFVEWNPYAQRVLQRHFPGVSIHSDICNYQPNGYDGAKTITYGGFPCQDISGAGKRRGIKPGTRSGLFFELMRVVRMVRPRIIYLENVAALLSADGGISIVLGELSQAGYDAEWAVVSAQDVGAVHKRERAWIIAYPNDSGRLDGASIERQHRNSLYPQWDTPQSQQSGCGWFSGTGSLREVITDAKSGGWDASGNQVNQARADATLECSYTNTGTINPSFCRADDGIPSGMDNSRAYLLSHDDLPHALSFATDTQEISHRKERLESLGNAVVPHVAAIGWRRIGNILNLY